MLYDSTILLLGLYPKEALTHTVQNMLLFITLVNNKKNKE